MKNCFVETSLVLLQQSSYITNRDCFCTVTHNSVCTKSLFFRNLKISEAFLENTCFAMTSYLPLLSVGSQFGTEQQLSMLGLHKKMNFSIKNFFSKCDQIRNFLRIWSHLLKKSLMENFCSVCIFAILELLKHFWKHLFCDDVMLNTKQEIVIIYAYLAQKVFLRIWSHLLKKSLMENFSFCSVLFHHIFHLTADLHELYDGMRMW